uniref:Solute carrier family 35 member F1 n=1 Tax=Echeneis naucrates TaxID=173247 RepID=A0A665WJ65_ECHNA
MVGADILLGRQQGLGKYSAANLATYTHTLFQCGTHSCCGCGELRFLPCLVPPVSFVYSGDQKLFGDLLVLGGATLYGISNVCEEFIVKNLNRVEFLGMIGLFGSFFSGIQLAIMEHKELLKVSWDWQIGLLYIGFSAFMFGLYSFMPVVMKRTSATSVNLSLLTADLYSLFCGLFLFHYKFSGLYLLSFFIIIFGLVVYSSSSTYVAQNPRVYKQFRNTSGQPVRDLPRLGPGDLEPSVTYTSLGPELGNEIPLRIT